MPLNISDYAQYWGLDLLPEMECRVHSCVAFGWQGSRPVVLKVISSQSNEDVSALALAYFAGNGAVRCIDQLEKAFLLERIMPGWTLTDRVKQGKDEQATLILCEVAAKLHAQRVAEHGFFEVFPTVSQWGRSFEQVAENFNHPALAYPLVKQAYHLYRVLSETQGQKILLHGDLHHENVLFGHDRGWMAIDPKGVVGEAEYEMGAALRNPLDVTLCADTKIIQRRIELMADTLHLNAQRITQWCFSQAVLAAIWGVEDGAPACDIDRFVGVAKATLPLL